MKTCSASYLFGDTNINIVLDLVKCKIVWLKILIEELESQFFLDGASIMFEKERN